MKYISFLIPIFLYLIFPSPTFAQSRTTRLLLPLGRVSIQLEQKDNQLTQKLLMHDHLSSTKAVISESGEVSTYPSYYPYGSSIAQTPVDMTDKQYTGQKKVSDDSSVYNYNARYYNPTTAIFIQPDSVRGPGRYTYVSGNPVQATDPSGHDLCQQDPSLSFLWNALGQCGNAQGEDFMGEKGLGSVGTLMAAAEAGSGGIGGLAAAIGDKISGNSSGSESINSAYSSLSGGAAAGIFAMGMMSPDPGDAGRGMGFVARFANKLDTQIVRDVLEGMNHRVALAKGKWTGEIEVYRGVKALHPRLLKAGFFRDKNIDPTSGSFLYRGIVEEGESVGYNMASTKELLRQARTYQDYLDAEADFLAQSGMKASQYVSTSTSLRVAKQFAGPYGYIITARVPFKNTLDVQSGYLRARKKLGYGERAWRYLLGCDECEVGVFFKIKESEIKSVVPVSQR